METIEAATSLIQSRAGKIFQILHDLWEELRQALPQLEAIVARETVWLPSTADQEPGRKGMGSRLGEASRRIKSLPDSH
ncbi:MAG: hypothetical protein R6W06_03605 [Prochlorococcaceae cyanobacterium]